MRPVEIDFTLSDGEREQLFEILARVAPNPYTDYKAFVSEIRALVARNDVRGAFGDALQDAKTRDLVDRPFYFMRNCPIDRELPVFDMKNPVESKYRLKQTFIAEAFLILYAEMSGWPGIGYKNVNAGDVLQDIFPKEDLYNSQSQKTLAPIGFHKDLANHFVRPDAVNILGLRSFAGNEIYTTFVRNIDLITHLGPEVMEVLRRPVFYTPYDDLSVYGDKERELGDAKRHPVVIGEVDFVYFERRTVAYTDDARAALVKLDEALHATKTSTLMLPGDFVAIANNTSLHGKDVFNIADSYQQRIRWSIKTVNVSDLAKHEQHYLPNQYGIVNG